MHRVQPPRHEQKSRRSPPDKRRHVRASAIAGDTAGKIYILDLQGSATVGLTPEQ